MRKVYENGKQYSTVEDLKDDIEAAWSSVDQATINNLYTSMSNQIFALISSHGGLTKDEMFNKIISCLMCSRFS